MDWMGNKTGWVGRWICSETRNTRVSDNRDKKESGGAVA